jgi:hypothetical protein
VKILFKGQNPKKRKIKNQSARQLRVKKVYTAQNSTQIDISQLKIGNNNILEPDNSVDCYKKNDDIISMNSSGISI